MSFLAPLFLLGAAAVALPILFHLIRRTTRDRVRFSSLMFLKPSPPRVTRRSRLENLLLLLLRCAVLALLALGFARPFWQMPMTAPPTEADGIKTVVLLDASASMQREGLWTEARAIAERWLRDARPNDPMALAAFDRGWRPVLGFDEWTATPPADRPALADQKLAVMRPSWSQTQVGNALISAVEWLGELDPEEDRPMLQRIVLISDMQQGAHLDGLQGFDWPKNLTVVIEPVRARPPRNAGLAVLPQPEDNPNVDSENRVRVRLQNSEDSDREQFQIQWLRAESDRPEGEPLDVYVPPGQSRILLAPPLPEQASNAPMRLVLTGDDASFDNTAWYVAPTPDRIHVIFLGDDAPDNPNQLFYYLRRALPDTRYRRFSVDPFPTASEPTAEDRRRASLAVVAGPQTETRIAWLKSLLDEGGTALFVLRSAVESAALAAVTEEQGWRAEEADVSQYSMFGEIDFTHPLFSPFADSRYNDFTRVHFWKHRRLDAPGTNATRVVARFDSGDPLLIQVQVGRGTALILTSGWHPADSQLALSSKFVPLLYSILEHAGAIRPGLAQYRVGESVALPASAGAAATLIKPDGTSVPVEFGGAWTPDLPGIYRMSGADEEWTAAVNLATEESKTAPIPEEEWVQLGIPVLQPATSTTAREEERKRDLQAAELENRQKIWRWLILATLAILILETWIAGRLVRPIAASSAAPAPAGSV